MTAPAPALEFTDRYDVLGIRPPRFTYCRGPCEATGWVPVQADADDPQLAGRWAEAETAAPSDDGWHFVVCPACQGTGRARTITAKLNTVAHVLVGKLRFFRAHVLVLPYPPFPRRVWAERTDRSWWWNRKVALRVLLRGRA